MSKCAFPVQSLDFSWEYGSKPCFVNLPVPFRPRGYMSYMRSCEDEYHMDGLLGIRQLYKFYRTFCEETWGPHYLSSPSQFEDVRDHGQIIDLPRFKLIRELNVSNCGLKCHLDLFFYLRVFPCLRRLDAARNQGVENQCSQTMGRSLTLTIAGIITFIEVRIQMNTPVRTVHSSI